MTIASPTPSTAAWTLQDDLDTVVAQTSSAWPLLAGSRLFISGGTGFIGRWLLETLRHANERLQLDIHATVLTRDPDRFAAQAPHLASHAGITLVKGDIATFDSPPGAFSHAIHAATDASAHLNEHGPKLMFSTVVDGTRRMLDFCAEKQVRRMLFLSSGAIYGPQPPEVTHVPESFRGGPDCLDARATYAEAKRAAEMLCAIYSKSHGMEVSVARIFAAVGPLLPLDTHFAAGNFIRDAMAGREIIINGDGRALRSYLYAGDLVAWLWLMLAHAPAGQAFNVGCEQAVSMRDLAAEVSGTLGSAGYRVLGKSDSGWNPGRYIPDTSAVRQALGVQKTVSLSEAIRRTALWNGWSPAP